MEYPRKVMRLSAMRDELSIPEEVLLTAYQTPGQTFARKINPKKRNSPIVFDTAEFEKWWLKRVKAQQRRENYG